MSLQEFKEGHQDLLLENPPTTKDDKWLQWMIVFSDMFYQSYPISKPNNRGFRFIESPLNNLKSAQKSLLWQFKKFEVHKAAFGLDKNDYLKNALVHKDKKSILTLDIKNFYKSTTLSKVRAGITKDIQLKDKIEELSPYIFFAPEGLTSPEDIYLATGSPLSPIISNFVMKEIDQDMQDLANKSGASYTRYLDDLTFSFDKELSKEERDKFYVSVIERVRKDGWHINWRKTKWLNPNQDAMVITGVDIRAMPKVTRRYIVRNLRPRINQIAIDLLRLNITSLRASMITHDTNSILKLISLIDPHLGGCLAYVKHVSVDQYDRLSEYFIKRVDRARLLSNYNNNTLHYPLYIPKSVYDNYEGTSLAEKDVLIGKALYQKELEILQAGNLPRELAFIVAEILVYRAKKKKV